MPYQTGRMFYLKPNETYRRYCLSCGNQYTKTEILDSGEEIEVWCWCEKCDKEIWQPIQVIEEK